MSVHMPAEDKGKLNYHFIMLDLLFINIDMNFIINNANTVYFIISYSCKR